MNADIRTQWSPDRRNARSLSVRGILWAPAQCLPSAVRVSSVSRRCWERRRSMLNSYPWDLWSHTSMDVKTYACVEATPGRLRFTGASWGDYINQTASPRRSDPGNWRTASTRTETRQLATLLDGRKAVRADLKRHYIQPTMHKYTIRFSNIWVSL
jgi:hypothetical protein